MSKSETAAQEQKVATQLLQREVGVFVCDVFQKRAFKSMVFKQLGLCFPKILSRFMQCILIKRVVLDVILHSF